MRILKEIGITFVITLICFMFINMQWNVTLWEQQQRMLVFIFTIILYIMYVLMKVLYKINNEPNNDN